MKIAIVHDELIRRGGGEKVALCFHYSFPDAPIFTMVYNPELTYPEFKNCKIRTSWFQRIVKNERGLKRLFFPFGLLAMKQLDITGYDVILISSTYCAKYVKISVDACVINYCHSPFRLAWYPDSYKEYKEATGLKRILFKTILNILRKIDLKAASRTNYYIANAEEMAQKIRAIYKPSNEIAVINPPVDVNNFSISDQIDDYFLVVGRLEYYKKTDIVIKAFNKLKIPLVVVGSGSQESYLKEIAEENISFRKNLSNADLAGLLSRCRALIFPQIEDYGITPLEANASGRPVIAYGAGGVLETMIPYSPNSLKATALFFYEQSPQALIEAVRRFESIEFDTKFIRERTEQFDTPAFVDAIRKFVLKAAGN